MREIFVSDNVEVSGFGDQDCISEVYDQCGAGGGSHSQLMGMYMGGGWGTGNLDQIMWDDYGSEMRMNLLDA